MQDSVAELPPVLDDVPSRRLRTVAAVWPLALAGTAGLLATHAAPGLTRSGAFVGLSTVALLVLLHATRRRARRAPVSVALATLAWAPNVAFGAFAMLHRVLLWAPGAEPKPASHFDGESSLLYFVPAAVVGSILASVLATRTMGGRTGGGAIRGAAVLAVVVASMLAALGVARWGLPEPDQYRDHFRMAGEIEMSEELDLGARVVRYVALSAPDAQGSERRCALEGVEDIFLQNVGQIDVSSYCVPLRFYVDDATDAAFAEMHAAGSRRRTYGFRLSTGAVRGVSVAEAAHRLAPPRGWMLAGVSGAAIAACLVLLGHLARRRAQRTGFADAEHVGDGWIEIGDGRRIHAPAAAALPTGRVVAALSAGGPASYRETGGPVVLGVEPGTLDDLRREGLDRATAFEASALALAALGMAPLVSCFLIRLV
jgi:hypothetical protein